MIIGPAGDGDFIEFARNLTFAAGSGDGALMCLSVIVLEDDVIEGEEDFSITLSLVTSRTSLSLGNSVMNVTLTDNDGKN